MAENKDFGVALRAIRIAADESVENVADAVEISTNQLKEIEAGITVPTEDILELFINHFSLRDSEALRLWELAGYSYEEELKMAFEDQDDKKPKELNVHVPQDVQILYTDMVHIAGNKFGVVINFIQGIGPTGKPTVVSRVGMSKEHAQSMVEVLKKSLENSEK